MDNKFSRDGALSYILNMLLLFFSFISMEQRNSMMQWVIGVLALVVGMGGGYYYGNMMGHNRGVEAGIAQEKAAEIARREAAEREAASAINPFNQGSANPFEKASANPFDDVNVNPFK